MVTHPDLNPVKRGLTLVNKPVRCFPLMIPGQPEGELTIRQRRTNEHIALVLCKRRLNKTANIREMRPFWKGYSLCKIVSLEPKWKMQQTFRKRLPTRIRNVLCKKTTYITRLIFEKWDVFKKWQNLPFYKGYSVCNIVFLGPKLKRQQTCENNSKLTLEIFKTKNRKKKKTNIQEMRHA